MRPELFPADALLALLRRQKIATMGEMKAALGTDVEMTVLRKLRALGYLSSYSHRGKFYTLVERARFDARGLFQVGDACFSRVGSLRATAAHFVAQSAAGYFAAELSHELRVQSKEALLTLFQRAVVGREKRDGRYLYCSIVAAVRQAQIERRRQASAAPGAGGGEETKAALLLFFGSLNERQRRLYAGLESLRVGHGGDRRVAAIMGLDVHTVARGRRELAAHDLDLERVRTVGGGRARVEKKRPT